MFKSEDIAVENNGATTLQWSVPKTLFYFDGHFPHNPVLPAVAIIDISAQFLQKAFPHKKLGRVFSVPSAKFSQPLGPDSKVTIHAQLDENSEWPNQWTVEWKDSVTLDVAAHLRIVLSTL